MPFAVYVLGLAVFAQGTSEFMLSGLIADLTRELSVSIVAGGSLTSVFAVGMIVGAPLMAVLSLRLPRRRALLAFLIAFMIVHIVGAITTSFAVLLVTRVLGALANAGFLAVGLATATEIAPPNAKGRAASILVSGVTVACIVGVPAGTVLGQSLGWRAAFWAVAVLCLPALIAIPRSIPSSVADSVVPNSAAPNSVAPSSVAPSSVAPSSVVPSDGNSTYSRARKEFRVLREPRLLVTMLLAALVNAATFGAFTYLAPLTTGVTGLADGWVPVILALFGLGSFVGVSISGRLSDARPMLVLIPGGIAALVGWVLFAAMAGNAVATVVLVSVQGAFSFAVGSTLIARILYAADGAPTLGGSFATVALNVGAAAGPAIAGIAISVGLGFRSPLWIGASLVLAAAVAAVISWATRRRALFVRPRARVGVQDGH